MGKRIFLSIFLFSLLSQAQTPGTISISDDRNFDYFVEEIGQSLITELKLKIGELYQSFRVDSSKFSVAVEFFNESDNLVCTNSSNKLVAKIQGTTLRSKKGSIDVLDQTIRYSGCDNTPLFYEHIHTEGQKLIELTGNQMAGLSFQRTFALKDNEIRRSYAIYDISSNIRMLSIDCIRRSTQDAVEIIMKIENTDVTRMISFSPQPGLKNLDIYRDPFSYSVEYKGNGVWGSTDTKLRLKLYKDGKNVRYRTSQSSRLISQAQFDTEFNTSFLESIGISRFQNIVDLYLPHFPKSQSAPVPSKIKEELKFYIALLESSTSAIPEALKTTFTRVLNWLKTLQSAVDAGKIKDDRH